MMGVPTSGDLSKTSPIHLYYLAASNDGTGLLSLYLADRRLDLFFRKGIPEHLDSAHPDDSIAAFLRRERLATDEQLQSAERAKMQFGGDLVSALFGLNVLQPSTALAHLSRRAAGLLFQVLTAETGTFTFKEGELAGQRGMPLGHRWDVLLNGVRTLPIGELKRRLAPVAQLPVMKSGGRLQTSELHLTPQETRALSRIDGVRSLAQLATDFPSEAETYSRLVFLFKELELISFGEPPPGSPPSPSPPRQDAPRRAPPPKEAPPKLERAPSSNVPPIASPVATPPPPPAPGHELLQLKDLAVSWKQKNHFDVLGLPESTDGSSVKVAYFKLAKLYHPDTVPPGAPEELAQIKSELFGRIGEAYRTLSDDKSRAEYLNDLKTGASEKVDVGKIFQAEELFHKGTLLVKARKFAEAIKTLDEAIAANSDEPEFYAWRGFAKFFTIADKVKGRAEALGDIQRCLKANDRVAPAHYLLGQIAKLTGNNAEAAQHFKRAVDLRPDYVDAQRELRMLTKK